MTESTGTPATAQAAAPSPQVLVDPTFHYIRRQEAAHEQTPQYLEYRRRWVENPLRQVVEDFPIHVDLEVTSACNLKCVMCFQSFNPPKYGYMDFELFKRVVDDGVAHGLASIKLNYRGEPLLHSKVIEMVRYAKDKGVIEVMFNTNGVMMDEKMARALIDAHLDKVIFSVEHYQKETYEKIRVGATWDQVLGNIKRLMALKQTLRTSWPVVRVQTCKFPGFDLKEYNRFWSQIVDDVAYNDLLDYGEYIKVPKSDPEPAFCCPQLWQRLMVMWDGKVTLCCGDQNVEMVVGNAKAESLHDIWTSNRVSQFREWHKNGESHKMLICNRCGSRKAVVAAIRAKRAAAEAYSPLTTVENS